ncbi:MAG TPA: PP2C family protein-serine/threonine phosphatase [Nocardioidaceae bacterium]|jgi:serine phosphatase RsbU (regulator of sigma subunit)|nr:PP2C family protein-serine/threonine phosphatase [Nocardioidaceae bacterium]
MAERRLQAVGAVLAATCLLGLAVADLLAPPTLILSALFALGPLIACAVLPTAATAGFAVTATVLALLSGVWNGVSGNGQQIVRVLDVAVISAAAVLVAWVRVRRERRHARYVAIAEVAQKAILPTLPRVAGQVSVASRYVSAAQDAVVGGDLYDCYHSAEHTRFLVGDVRGKGVAGVEQAARTIRAFRQSAATRPTLAAVAADMSGYLQNFFDDEEFVTAVLVDTTDPAALTLVSCGHPQPILVDEQGSATYLDLPAGLPLGLGDHYESVTVPWPVGERLLLYTDGLSEARDRRGEFLSLLSLEPQLTDHSVDEALDAVLTTVRRHVPGGHLNDDLAVVLLERTGHRDGPSVEYAHDRRPRPRAWAT